MFRVAGRPLGAVRVLAVLAGRAELLAGVLELVGVAFGGRELVGVAFGAREAGSGPLGQVRPASYPHPCCQAISDLSPTDFAIHFTHVTFAS